MELDTKTSGNAQIVTPIAERIDAAVATRFKDAMRDATDEGSSRVILNLGQVNFVDSSGLGAIVTMMKHLGSNRKMDLAGLNPDVEKVFRLTRMDSVFNIYVDVDTAMAGAPT